MSKPRFLVCSVQGKNSKHSFENRRRARVGFRRVARGWAVVLPTPAVSLSCHSTSQIHPHSGRSQTVASFDTLDFTQCSIIEVVLNQLGEVYV